MFARVGGVGGIQRVRIALLQLLCVKELATTYYVTWNRESAQE
jgi:hypothetical protein